MGWRYLQGDPRYRIWTRLITRLIENEKKKTICLVSGIFPGIADIIILLRCRMYYKPTKFYENRWSHFWENENFKCFFLCELPLFLSIGERSKMAWDLCKRFLDIKFEWDRSIVLGSMFGNGHTDTHIFF